MQSNVRPNSSDIIIQDDFLDKEYFKKLQDLVFGLSFPWFVSPSVRGDKPDANYQMVHVVYGNHAILSDFYNELGPLFTDLDIFVALRIKLNLLKREEKIIEHGMHIDVPNAPDNALTSLLYMNTNNGYTKFETGEKVKSVENRLVTFQNDLMHTGSTNNCEAINRCVMNIDWIKRKIK
jgi:hypothetical protein|tara:strand:- start:77 stop:613 length:537 start_codon:yes stop_codon:yes gene_type:complete